MHMSMFFICMNTINCFIFTIENVSYKTFCNKFCLLWRYRFFRRK